MRAKAFEQLCAKYNLAYEKKDEYGVINHIKGFKRFGGGTLEHLSSLKSLDLTHEVFIADYKYVIIVGKVPVTMYRTVFFVNSTSLDLPVFEMKPESFSTKLNEYFGAKDIDFELSPEFSNAYNLGGEHDEFIRFTFDDQVLSYFSESKGWFIDATNYYLCISHKDEKVKDENLDSFYTACLQIYQLFIKN
jgi:hypothetical protein